MVETAPLGDVPGRIWALFGARFLDAAATTGLVTIVGKQVFDMTVGRPDAERFLMLGYLGLIQFLPALLLAPFVGPLADRFDRRFVSAAGGLGYAALSLGLFMYVRTDPRALWPIFVLMLLQGSTEAFQRPANRALPFDLAPEHTITRVAALMAVSWQSAGILGPIAAGFLFTVSPATPYLVFVVAFLASSVAVMALPATGVAKLSSDREGRSSGVQAFRDAIEGFRFVRSTPVLGAAITMDFFAAFFGGLIALLPAIADQRLGVGAIGLGGLRAAVGIGAALVTIGLAIKPLERRIGPILLGAVAIYGLGTMGVALSTNYIVAFGFLMLLAGADSVSVFIRTTLVPLATPESMRGRVLALENVFIGASNELGGYESGLTASWFGLVGALMFGGVGTLVVVGAYAFVFRSLLEVDTFSDVRPKASL